MAQIVNNLPVTQVTEVWALIWEYPLEKGMATHSGILAWRIPWTDKPGRLQFMRSHRIGHDQVTNTFGYGQRDALFLMNTIWQRCRGITLITLHYIRSYLVVASLPSNFPCWLNKVTVLRILHLERNCEMPLGTADGL